MSAWTRGAPLRSARSMPRLRSTDTGRCPARARSRHRSPVPLARSRIAAAGGQAERAHGPAPPAHVEAERHDPVDEVVARGDGVEHVAHGGALLVALRQRVAVPAGGGRHRRQAMAADVDDGGRQAPTAERRRLAGPAVVGLAGRGADDLVDEHDGLRQLVAGDVAGGVGEQRRPSSTSAPSRGRTMATTSLPQRSLGPAGDDAVVHAGVGLDGHLDLLGEDLLAAGVDRHGVAAVQLDRRRRRASGPGRRGRRSARRRRPGTCAPSCRRRRGSRAPAGRSWPASRPRRRPAPARAVEVGRQHVVAGPGGNVPVDASLPVEHVGQLAAGLRRAEAVDDHHRRQVAEQLLLRARPTARRRRTARR